MPTPRPPRRRSPFGFLFIAVLNVFALVMVNLHDWWRPFTQGVVTARFGEVVWAANLSVALLIVGNLLLMRWSMRAQAAALTLVLEAGKLISAVVTASVFPFDLQRFGDWAPTAGHVFLVLAAFVSASAMLVYAVRLVRLAVARARPLTLQGGVLKARVVYESIFGNTRDVALAIAKGLRRAAGVEVEVSEVGAAEAVASCDLLVVGGPVHAWSMTRAMTRTGAREQAAKAGREVVSQGIGVRDYLEHLAPATRAAAATFDTAASVRWMPVGSAARPAARTLDALGYQLVARPEHFYVKDVMGPLNAGELARAEAWGAQLAERCLSR